MLRVPHVHQFDFVRRRWGRRAQRQCGHLGLDRARRAHRVAHHPCGRQLVLFAFLRVALVGPDRVPLLLRLVEDILSVIIIS